MGHHWYEDLTWKSNSVKHDSILPPYTRPLLGQIHKLLKLDVHFTNGHDNWIYYTDNYGQEQKVLDCVGGYGANIFGHWNPSNENREYSTLGMLQNSYSSNCGKLSQILNDLLIKEVNEGSWISTFSSTGSESVEIALKKAILYYTYRVKVERFILNQSYCKIKNIDGSLLETLKYENNNQLNKKAIIFSLSKAYHGLTFGVLDLTDNSNFKDDYHCFLNNHKFQNICINPMVRSITDLENELMKYQIELKVPKVDSSGKIHIEKRLFNPFCAFFIEPFQGEAGVLRVPHSVLTWIRDFTRKTHCLLVCDEVQTGVYRTGKLAALSHSNLVADIYCFSKALGAGQAKISATLIHEKFFDYVSDININHQSTFAEDNYSSHMAIRVLKEYEKRREVIEEDRVDLLIEEQLELLQANFSSLIKDVRGCGFLWAIELDENYFNQIPELYLICQENTLGHFISGLFLHKENIRIFSTLSNGTTFRIFLSVSTTYQDVLFLMSGLNRLFTQIKCKNWNYLFSFIFEDKKINLVTNKNFQISIDRKKLKSDRDFCYFIGHHTDWLQFKRLVPSLSNISELELSNNIGKATVNTKIAPFQWNTFCDKNGHIIDCCFFVLPVTMEEILYHSLSYRRKGIISPMHLKLLDQLQGVIDKADKFGAKCVGFGAGTSILAGNGTLLDSSKTMISTGNTFTCALTLLEVESHCQKLGIELSNAHVAFVGPIGNIIKNCVNFMVKKCREISLFYHTPLERSHKFQKFVLEFLNDAFNDDSMESEFLKQLHQIFSGVKLENWSDLEVILNTLSFYQIFQASNDYDKIQQADIVICGASCSRPFLTKSHFRKNQLVIDLAEPSNVSQDVVNELINEIKYVRGGFAQLPKTKIKGHNEIHSPFNLLPKGIIYGCLAETLMITFLGDRGQKFMGDITHQAVAETIKMAKETGIELAPFDKNKGEL